MKAYLGLNYNIHNAAAALVVDGQFVAGAEEERFSRIKYDGNFPKGAIEYCLQEAGITARDLSGAGFYWQVFNGLGRRAGIILKNAHTIPSFLRIGDRSRGNLGVLLDHLRAPGEIRRKLNAPNLDVARIEHHLCHCASTYYPSPFDRALILSIDLAGEWSSTYAAVGEDHHISKIWEIGYPHSFGVYYAAMTQYLGFAPNADEYRVMGLAAYGKPVYADLFRKWLRYHPPDGLQLDLERFVHHRGGETWYSDLLVKDLGPAREPGENFDDPRWADIAASTQLVLEEVLLKMLGYLRESTGERNLCLAGGVALNSKVNGEIRRARLFDEIFVQPASHDAGTSLGAALHLAYADGRQPRNYQMKHSYYGPGYSDEECLAVAQQFPEVAAERCADPAEAAAERLAAGQVLGWFQGRMEWGPRALGARSIVADPRPESMKDTINAKVKFRELFRPFAPAILAEKTAEWFTLPGPSPFMLEVYPWREEVKAKVPAVVHADGTGRLQTVDQDSNPRYYRLIQSFEKRTGIPVILNTSFNVKGEPIVCRPEEAIRCFLRTELDALVLGDLMVVRRNDPRPPRR